MTRRPLNAHEQTCLDRAAYFTAVRGRSPRNRIRETFKSLDAARAFAATHADGKTMLYAVTEEGRFAHIENA